LACIGEVLVDAIGEGGVVGDQIWDAACVIAVPVGEENM
jgi:hypothetical protein